MRTNKSFFGIHVRIAPDPQSPRVTMTDFYLSPLILASFFFSPVHILYF